MAEIIKDFDKLILDKRIAKLAGKEFDVSLVPTRQALKYIKFRDRVIANTMTGEETLRKMASIVAEICGRSIVKGNIFKRIFNKTIDENWILNHTNFEQLQIFMDFVIAPLMEKAEDVKAEKKSAKSRTIELGKIITSVICMTGYLINYILDELSLDQLMMIYAYGIEFEETKSIILLNKYGEALSGKRSKPKVDIDKPPPKYDELKAMFGSKVQPIVKE